MFFFVAQTLFAMSSIQYPPPSRVCSEAVGGCCEAPPMFADPMLSGASQERSARGRALHAARYVLGRSSSLFTQL